MREQVKFGTYSVTLRASDWCNILIALGGYKDSMEKLGLLETAEDVDRTLDELRPQIMEWRV